MDIDRRDLLTRFAASAAAAPLARRPLPIFDPDKLVIERHEGSYPPKTSILYDGVCLGRCDDPPLADHKGIIRRAPFSHWAKMVTELLSRGGDRLEEDTYGAEPSAAAPPLAR